MLIEHVRGPAARNPVGLFDPVALQRSSLLQDPWFRYIVFPLAPYGSRLDTNACCQLAVNHPPTGGAAARPFHHFTWLSVRCGHVPPQSRLFGLRGALTSLPVLRLMRRRDPASLYSVITLHELRNTQLTLGRDSLLCSLSYRDWAQGTAPP
jgi:hypothetical protein